VTRPILASPLPPLRPDPVAPVPVPAGPPAPGLRRRSLRLVGRAADAVLARCSEVGDAAVLDVRLFPWTAELRANWRTIRDEAAAVAPQVGRWRAFPLWRAGVRIDANAARCPATAALAGRIPGLESMAVSVLAPGVHLPVRRGPTKALVTCHLGLTVPRDGDVRMRVGARTVRWAEGETLVFDDTRPHAVWNDTGGARAVLLVRVRRPLRRPGRWLATLALRVLRRTRSSPI
jgi:ornithine lipid ester-linked acyl 2-hydroxylase